MPLKCVNCGNIFDECEAGVYFEYHDEIPGVGCERFFYCPCCGGDEIENTVHCEKCRGEFLKDELIAGLYCEECLRDTLTFDVFLDFATTGVDKLTEVDTLEDFVFTKIFGLRKAPDESNSSLKAWCKTIYNEVNKTVLLPAVFEYMDDMNLWGDFAEYLYGKEASE